MFVALPDFSVVFRKGGLDVAVSLGVVELPGPRVEFLSRLPLAKSMLHAIDEGSMVDVPIGPDEQSIGVFRLVVHELAHKDVSPDEL